MIWGNQDPLVREHEEQSRDVMQEIEETINMEICGLNSTVAFYNLHQSILKLGKKSLQITMEGL